MVKHLFKCTKNNYLNKNSIPENSLILKDQLNEDFIVHKGRRSDYYVELYYFLANCNNKQHFSKTVFDIGIKRFGIVIWNVVKEQNINFNKFLLF